MNLAFSLSSRKSERVSEASPPLPAIARHARRRLQPLLAWRARQAKAGAFAYNITFGRLSVQTHTLGVADLKVALESLLAALEASRASCLRAWKVLQRLRAIPSDFWAAPPILLAKHQIATASR